MMIIINVKHNNNMIRSITEYDNCDINITNGNNEYISYDASISFETILIFAICDNYQVITKNGNGRWYLKSFTNDYKYIKKVADTNANKYPRIKTWLVEYI